MMTSALTNLPKAPPDQTVARRYALRRLVGSGGSCEVFEAVHLVTGRIVALKILRAEHRHDLDARGRLLQEARALASVQHPNLLEVLDAEIDEDGEPFIALEMLQGRPLEGVLVARTRLAVAEAVDWIRPVARAVAELHAAGWVHRDIKPANIFLVQEGACVRPKLLDLGIALPRGVEADGRRTTRGTILGTPQCMAPEQAMGEADDVLGAQTDVWQLGATLFDMLTGRVPYEGSYASVLVQMTNGAPVRARSLRPEIPAALDDIIARALAVSPDERYPDAEAFERALANLELPAASSPRPTVSGRRHRRAALLAPARALLPNAIVDVRTEDVSESGLLVLSSAPLPEGATLCIRMALPLSGRVATVPCIVRWVRNRAGQGAAGPFAVGLEFVDLDPRVHQEVTDYVDALGN